MQRKLNNTEKKRISPHVTAFIGATITLIGGFFLSYNYVQAKKVIAYDYMANAFYTGTEVITITEEEKTKKPERTPTMKKIIVIACKDNQQNEHTESIKGGQKYYVRICTYKKTSSGTYKSAWSKTLTVTTKK